MKIEQTAALRIANIVIEKAKENSISKIGKIVIHYPHNIILNLEMVKKEFDILKIEFKILNKAELIYIETDVNEIKIDTIESY